MCNVCSVVFSVITMVIIIIMVMMQMEMLGKFINSHDKVLDKLTFCVPCYSKSLFTYIYIHDKNICQNI